MLGRVSQKRTTNDWFPCEPGQPVSSQFLSSTCSRRKPFGINGTVTQPEHRATSENHPFFTHDRIPKGRDVAVFMPAVQRQSIHIYHVITGSVQILEKFGKSWNLKLKFSRPWNFWKMIRGMEKSAKILENYEADLENIAFITLVNTPLCVCYLAFIIYRRHFVIKISILYHYRQRRYQPISTVSTTWYLRNFVMRGTFVLLMFVDVKISLKIFGNK